MANASHRDVRVMTDAGTSEGILDVPPNPRGVVIFAHGAGSSRSSPRNALVAEALRKGGVGTLLIDLLTSREEGQPQARFDIPLLTRRLDLAVQWLLGSGAIEKTMPVGLFGASTGAAAALMVAARGATHIAAVVSRGGRPDLAEPSALAMVRAPTLLIVGGADRVVLEANRAAYSNLRCEARLEVIPGATHLFEEPGALTRVAQLARDWFTRHLRGGHASAAQG